MEVDDAEDIPLDMQQSDVQGDDEASPTSVEEEPLDYETPTPEGETPFFWDAFTDASSIGHRWLKSEATKAGLADQTLAKYDGEWAVGTPDTVVMTNDLGLIVKSKAHHHAIAAKLERPFAFEGKPLVFQYDLKYQQGQECGGGYVKLLTHSEDLDLREFQDKTPYTIMFGPDKCGMTSKVHFIIRYENPKNNTIHEHHAKQPSKSLDGYFNDHKTHLYTLVINPDDTFKVSVDQTEIISGSLLKDLEPPITPPKEVEDPEDKKPEDWDDREKISDPDAVKPDDWDEDAPENIVDADATKPDDWLEDEEADIPDDTAVKPEDWDDDMDGQWEPPKIKNSKCENLSGCGKWTAPLIKNPAYKGKWKAPKIDNSNYKGKWSPRIIDNPNYFEVDSAYKMNSIGAVGIELWTMSDGILFDDFLLTDDPAQADAIAQATWAIKQQQERRFANAKAASESFFNGLIQQANDKPWLWGILVIVILIPIVLISFFCFGGSKDKQPEDGKKTDALTADDEGVGTDDDESESTAAPPLVNEGEQGDGEGVRKRRASASPARKQAASRDDLEEEDDVSEATKSESPGRHGKGRRQD